MAGKGDKYRPVNKKLFDANFDQIKKVENIDIDFKLVKIDGKLVKRKVYKDIK